MKRISQGNYLWLLILLLTVTLAGCVTFSNYYKLGTRAEMNRNYDEAIKYYQQALLENPKESVYRLAYLRARASAAINSAEKARKLLAEGRKEEAIDEYKRALEYDPTNRVIQDEYNRLTGRKPLQEARPKEVTVEQPVKLKYSPDKLKLKFTDASLKTIFQTLGKISGINFLFDEQFRDLPVSIDLSDMNLEQAINALCLAGKAFSRIIDERTVIIVPDNPNKRAQYEINAIKTFYLSNINAQDVQQQLMNILRTQYRGPTVMVDKSRNSLTIRDNPKIVALAEKLLRAWDKPKGEVIIDLEIMEVSRRKLANLGLQFSQSYAGIRYSGENGPPQNGWLPMQGLNFSTSANYQITLPYAMLQFLETDSDTKVIAQPRLRGVDSEEIKYLVGQKVPIPQTTWSPIAAGGVNTQPITSYQYQDVGIEVNIKPRLHQENEVSLELEVKITSISGTGVADIPIISTREIKNTIRLKDGETNLLAGLLKDEERKSLKGIVGLKSLPILGNLFSNTDRTVEQTDVILTITPHIIRTMPLSDEDGKPLWIENETLSFVSNQPEIYPESSLEEGEELSPEALARETRGFNSVVFNPGSTEIPAGNTFSINLEIQSQTDITAASVSISFDAKLLRLKEIQRGELVVQFGEKASFLQSISPGGTAVVGFSSPSPTSSVKAGTLAVLVFEAVSPGQTGVRISSIQAIGLQGRPVSLLPGEHLVTIR